MTKFMSKKFSVGGYTKAYADNYDSVFRRSGALGSLAELEDATDLGSVVERREGSSPSGTTGTEQMARGRYAKDETRFCLRCQRTYRIPREPEVPFGTPCPDCLEEMSHGK